MACHSQRGCDFFATYNHISTSSEVSPRRRSSASERQTSTSTCAGCRTCNSGWFTCWSARAFFSFCHDHVGTDVQHPCGVTCTTHIQGHLNDLLFDRRRLPWVTIVQQECTPRTAFFSAPVPLLALPGLAMADDVGPVTVRTVQDLEKHDVTRSRWGYSVSETLVEKSSTSTPVRHLPENATDYRLPSSCLLYV